MPAILDAPGAVVSTSNKRDVVDGTRGVREAAAPVWVFDPQKIAQEEPDWWWNPLSYVTDEEKAYKLTQHFSVGSRVPGSKPDALTHDQIDSSSDVAGVRPHGVDDEIACNRLIFGLKRLHIGEICTDILTNSGLRVCDVLAEEPCGVVHVLTITARGDAELALSDASLTQGIQYSEVARQIRSRVRRRIARRLRVARNLPSGEALGQRHSELNSGKTSMGLKTS